MEPSAKRFLDVNEDDVDFVIKSRVPESSVEAFRAGYKRNFSWENSTKAEMNDFLAAL